MSRFTAKFITNAELPLVIEPIDKTIRLTEFFDLLQSENALFKQHLLTYGGILFRNFPVQNAQDFAGVIKHLQTGPYTQYLGGDSPRKKVLEGIYTSTETPPSMTLPLHNELSYFKHYPTHIYFYCEIAPKAKGETIIGDARKIYRDIDAHVKERFVEKGLRYASRYPFKSKLFENHKSWTHVFETEDKTEVEKKCFENGISFAWNKHDWLQISQVRPSVLTHPETDEKVWFNQAHHFDFNPRFLGWWRYLATKLYYFRKYTLLHDVHFADGSKIARDDLYHIFDVMDRNTVAFPWQKGDLLVLDNILTMHGRAPFKGKRRVLTAMTS